MLTIQGLTDQVNKLLCNVEHQGRQEERFLRESEINIVWNICDGFFQRRYCLVDTLEVEYFPIAGRDIMENIDSCDIMLQRITYRQAATVDVVLPPGATPHNKPPLP